MTSNTVKRPVEVMKVAKEVSSIILLITLSGTIVSFLTNFLIFDAWGIPFAAVVSASDIVTGGAEAVESTFILLLPLTVAVPLGKWFSPKFRTCHRLRILSWFIILIVYLFFLINIKAVPAIDFPTIEVPKNIFNILYLSAVTVLFFMALLNADMQHGYYFVGFSVLLACLFQLDRTTANRYGEMIVFADTTRCAQTEYVVWAGTSSLVTTCSPPPHNRGKYYFIVERSDKTLRVQNEKILKGL